MGITELQNLYLRDLQSIAKKYNIPNWGKRRKGELVFAILEEEAKKPNLSGGEGVLEILTDGYGFLRAEAYSMSANDIYVSPHQIRKFAFRTGDSISCEVRPPRDGENYRALLRVNSVNGCQFKDLHKRPKFETLIPNFPDNMFNLEDETTNYTNRVIDLICPIGKGQRGLIVAPPKAGKTVLLKNIANSLREKYPDVITMMLLIDERPEE
ncbi:Rho termination factor N-terminal domain-containing protein, partial [bacterium]|nr:Rho termination factor N-terminal domain-containing protein [bacterium]